MHKINSSISTATSFYYVIDDDDRCKSNRQQHKSNRKEIFVRGKNTFEYFEHKEKIRMKKEKKYQQTI